MQYTIVMGYLGGILSENAYKFQTKRTKPFVRLWMRELCGKAEALNVPKAEAYIIKVSGRFWDRASSPDLSNLHKVIGDSLKKAKGQWGLGIDDKYFKFEDKDVVYGKLDPEVEIEIVPC